MSIFQNLNHFLEKIVKVAEIIYYILKLLKAEYNIFENYLKPNIVNQFYSQSYSINPRYKLIYPTVYTN